jgi:TetR/AcrR family transcriptional repressor of nem operon
MRVSREKMAEHRERILDAAARLFRERGVEAISIAEVMQRAGLTHGGFYRHFASKDDLAAQACGRAFDGALARLERKRGDPARYARGYLTERHRDEPGDGCPIASLAAEIGASGEPVQAEFVQGLVRYIERLSGALPRERAVALVSTLVGALLLARATAAQAPELSSEILASVREHLANVELADG